MTTIRGTDPPERIAQLVRTLREAEEELQALTGGQLDAVVSEDAAPFLLRAAQERLRWSEGAQRALAETQTGILNALPAHIALLDPSGVILAVNEAWRRFASANVLHGTNFCVGQNYVGVCESAHGGCADEAPSVAAGIRGVLNGELKAFALEYPCHSPTEKRWFRLMVTPLSGAPGTGAVVMHVNVTERRQAEEVLRQKEREQRRLAEELTIETQRLRESQAVASVGSWETDLATLEVKWTNETFRIFETSPEQFTPTHQGFLQRIHPEDRQRVEDAFKSSVDRSRPFLIEHRLLFPDGRIKHVELRGQVFNDATGSPVRAFGTCQDTTQRKVADELVRLRARQQETIARIGFEATRATTLEGIFAFATNAIAEALEVELCKVLQLAPDGTHLRLVSGVGLQAELIGVATVGVDRGSQAGFTLISDGPIYVNDFANETRFESSPLLRQHQVVSGLSVKMMLRDKPWGVLGAHCRTARSFNDVDADFMQAVAALLAVVIERLAVQHTLTESEARMRDAQRIAHLGNWELDIARNELSWSDEVFRIFGVEPAAFSGSYEDFLAIVHPEDREAVQNAWQVTLSERSPLVIEHRILRPDGEIRHVRERGELIHDESGRPTALSGTVLDTTDLRTAQSRAEQMTALLTEAQRIANMGSWDMDLVSGKLMWSAETCRLFGIRPEEFGGTFEAFTGLILPEDQAAYATIHARITPETSLLEAEYRIRRPDGAVRWMFERGRVTFDAAGNAIRRLGVVMDVTERKRAEAELREGAERFRLMIEGSEQVLFYTHDREHVFDYLSPSTRDVLGYEPGELVGQPCDVLVIAGDPLNTDVHGLTDRALQDGKPSGPYPAVVRHKDGRRIVLEILESPILRDGQIVGIQGFARDITERENVLSALAESQRQYRELVETSRSVIWTVDVEERFTFVNQAARTVFGREPEEMLGHRYREFVLDDPTSDGVLAQMLRDGQDVTDYSNRIRRKDGTVAILNSDARVVRDPQGRVIGVSGMSQDTTEVVRAQEAIARSEARFRGLFEQAAVGMCLVSAEGEFLRTNARFCEIVGYSAEELLQRDHHQTTHPDDREREAEIRSRMLARELQTAAWEKRYLHKHGHAVWCHLTLSLLPGDGDQERQFVAVIEDITERRAATERLRQSEQLLQLAGRIARMGAWSVDFPEVRITWSDEVCAIHDMPAGTVPALDQALAFYAPESRPVIESAFAICASEGTPFDVEMELLSAKGQRKWVRSIGEAERDQTGAIRRVHGAFHDITERKAAEETARSSAERLAQTLETITDGFFTLDREWRFTYVNAEAEKLLLRQRSTLLGCSIWEAYPEAAGSTFEREYRKAVATNTAVAFEEYYPPLGFWTEVKAYPTAEGLAVYFRDVTERRRLNEALRASESKFRRLAESNILGIMFWDAQGNISDANDAFLQIVGYTREELETGRISWRSMTPPDHVPQDERALAEIAATGSCTPYEKEFLHKDGHRVAIMVRAAAQGGATDAGICFVVDISQQKQAVAALRVSEERFRLLSKATNDAIWDWNLLTDDVWWNEGYENLFGYARAEADPTIKSWTEHIHPEDRARVTEGIRRAIDHGAEAWSDEYRFQCRDGRYAYVLDRGHVIRDATGKPMRLIGGMTDLTRQKEHEIALSQSNRALQMLSRCNEALIRSEEESELLAAICQIAVDIGGFRLAWVGYALDDAQKTVACQSYAGIEDGYLSEALITWDENHPSGQGPAGNVIRHGKPVMLSDLEIDESFRPWREAARARGFRGKVALPLADGSRTFGVFVLYQAEVRRLLPDEVRLLQELANDMAFGIVNLRARSAQQRMHTAVGRVAASVSAAASTDFFEQLTRNMVAALGAKAGFVAKMLPGEPITARTMAVVVDDQVSANFDYVLQGTPCESFFTSDTCVIHKQVAQPFPQSPTLAALGAEGFVGRRLDNASGAFIGQMVVMFREPLKDADFVVSTLQIFSARAAAELERQETDTKLREQAALLDKAQDAIVVRDLDHRISYWNSSAERLYGWTAQEVLGRSARELLYSDLHIFDQAVEKLIAHGEWTGEYKHRRRDGRILDIEGRWTLVRDAAGQPKTVLAIHSDVTERRQQERHAQRSQRLEAIGTLAGGIAHDLNNALAPILMSSDWLRTQYPGESEAVDMIENGSRRAADMVRQLLAFAKGAAGERVSVQTDRLVKEMEKLIRASFPRNIRLVVKCDAHLPTVLGDATQLHQVLLNLCVNARDAMPAGGKLSLEADSQVVDAVFASSVPDSRPGRYVVLRVRDTGTGIPAEVLDRIFDPFFTTKGPDRGSGLGLSTVMGIVKGHGGFLQVYSQPGQGSTFAAYLPAEAAGMAAEQVTPPLEKFRGQGETILFVDDEAALRRMAHTILHRMNFNPLTASDGADGLLQAVQHRAEIRAIITDLHMPHMDGLVFVRTLRRMLPDIPVLVASGRLEDDVAAEFKSLGVTARLDKPFTQEQLTKALKDLLRPLRDS